MTHRIRDTFAQIHEEERTHSGSSWWGQEEECGEPVLGEFSAHYDDLSGKWLPSLTEAVGKFLEAVEERKREQLRIDRLTSRLQSLEGKVRVLEKAGSIIVPITTFVPEPFDLLREIRAVVEQVDEDEYLATFFDANVSAAGFNPSDAIENLKDALLSRFDYLDSLSPKQLGPMPKKQVAVLRAFIRRHE